MAQSLLLVSKRKRNRDGLCAPYCTLPASNACLASIVLACSSYRLRLLRQYFRRKDGRTQPLAKAAPPNLAGDRITPCALCPVPCGQGKQGLPPGKNSCRSRNQPCRFGRGATGPGFLAERAPFHSVGRTGRAPALRVAPVSTDRGWPPWLDGEKVGVLGIMDSLHDSPWRIWGQGAFTCDGEEIRW